MFLILFVVSIHIYQTQLLGFQIWRGPDSNRLSIFIPFLFSEPPNSEEGLTPPQTTQVATALLRVFNGTRIFLKPFMKMALANAMISDISMYLFLNWLPCFNLVT